MTQQEFADLVGVKVATIDKRERDEDAWEPIESEIADKICAQYASMASYQPGKEERKETLGLKENEKKPTRNMGANCKRLRSKREEMGLSQKAFAQHVGLSVQTIYQLERDEARWGTMADETVEKIYGCFNETAFSRKDSKEETKQERKKFGNWSDALIVNEDGSVTVDGEYVKEKSEKEESKSDLVEIVEDPKALKPIPELMIKHIVDESDELTNKDRQLMKYVEFACCQLKESKSHEDFETNIDILTRIIKKQY